MAPNQHPHTPAYSVPESLKHDVAFSKGGELLVERAMSRTLTAAFPMTRTSRCIEPVNGASTRRCPVPVVSFFLFLYFS